MTSRGVIVKSMEINKLGAFLWIIALNTVQEKRKKIKNIVTDEEFPQSAFFDDAPT